eukprot:6606991-Prymnesium_polylepis.2
MGSVTDNLKTLACTSTSCCVADGLCLPLDFIKTRMQLQNELVPQGAPKLGVVSMTGSILRTEGPLAFYAGFPAAMLRQSSYGGLCFAAYPYIRDSLNTAAEAKDAPLWTRLVAGATAGGVASAMANPTDVVKVRLQADGRLKLAGGQPRYDGTLHAFRSIWAAEGGLVAFYKGCLPNVQRAIVVNGVGIAAYDHSKQTAQRLLGVRRAAALSPRRGRPFRWWARASLATRPQLRSPLAERGSLPSRAHWPRAASQDDDSLASRFVAALVGGVTTSLVGCPFDVLKTRMMNQHRTKPLYTNVLDCAMSVARVEGVTALWKGLLPVYARQA